MLQFSGGNRFFRSLLATIAVTTFVTLCFFLVRSEQVLNNFKNFDTSRFRFGSHGLTQCPANLSTPSSPAPPAVNLTLPPKKGQPELLNKVPAYLHAILDPHDETFQRLNCPLTSDISKRYAYLQTPPTPSSLRQYYFALDLHQAATILPQLMSTIFQVINFLGPHNCVLSIVEGRSSDGTYEVLRSLAPHLKDLGVPYFLQLSGLSPQRANPERIVLLAELRNQALRDLYEHPESYAFDATIIFINDVYICPEDMLEMVHQQKFQEADMTCGMDWANSSKPELPRLYDTWIARSMTGDTFYKGMFGWDEGFFFDHEPSRKRWDKFLPVQVFSCWNGIVALTAKPFMDGSLRFRGIEGGDRERKDEECYQGEPNLLTKDLWYLGYNRISTLPTIMTAYEYWEARLTREIRGPVSQHVLDGKHGPEEKIAWEPQPPEKFKCIPGNRADEWVPWDQGLKNIYGERRIIRGA
jgi:alpha-1,3-mannosyltransferase